MCSSYILVSLEFLVLRGVTKKYDCSPPLFQHQHEQDEFLTSQ